MSSPDAPDLHAEITALREDFASLRDSLSPKDKPESEDESDDEIEKPAHNLREAERNALIRVRAHTRNRTSPTKK